MDRACTPCSIVSTFPVSPLYLGSFSEPGGALRGGPDRNNGGVASTFAFGTGGFFAGGNGGTTMAPPNFTAPGGRKPIFAVPGGSTTPSLEIVGGGSLLGGLGLLSPSIPAPGFPQTLGGTT